MLGRSCFVACAAVWVCMPSWVSAQVERSGGGELQKFVAQYQQVAAEKAALQTQLAEVKKDLDAANTELAAVKKERDAAKAHTGVSPALIQQANASKETAEKNLEQSKQKMADLVTRFREMATNLKDVEQDRANLRADLADRSNAFDKCAEDNLQLYDVTRTVLDRYDHVGLFTKASATEPFTRITRTRIDNLVVEYRERAEQLRVKKTVTPTNPR